MMLHVHLGPHRSDEVAKGHTIRWGWTISLDPPTLVRFVRLCGRTWWQQSALSSHSTAFMSVGIRKDLWASDKQHGEVTWPIGNQTTCNSFVIGLVQANNNENTKAPHWSTGGRWIHLTKGPMMRRAFPCRDIIRRMFKTFPLKWDNRETNTDGAY